MLGFSIRNKKEAVVVEFLSFSIENYRSFNKRQTINLKDDSDRLITAIYGSNASGKSNVIKALNLVLNCIRQSTNANWKLPYEPFMLNTTSIKKPSSFMLDFSCDKRRFRYDFSFDREKITSETLLEQSPNSEKYRTIFAREGNGNLNSTAGKNKFGKKLVEKTRPDSLLITKAREDNNEYANIVFSLLDSISIVQEDIDFAMNNINSIELIRNNESMKTRVLDLLRKSDFAIRGIEINNVPFPEGFFDSLPFELPQEIKAEILANGSTEFKTVHAVRDEEGTVVSKAFFDFAGMESRGTQRFFEVLVPMLDALENDKTLFIDEFGSDIHVNAARAIINMLKNQSKINHLAKIVLITHNTSLMSELDRGDILLFDKTLEEETRVCSMKKAGARKGDAIEKRYIAGHYGGVPQIKAFG